MENTEKDNLGTPDQSNINQHSKSTFETMIFEGLTKAEFKQQQARDMEKVDFI